MAETNKSDNSKRSVHHYLGGGAVADILLWRRRNLTVGILVSATVFWFLFDRAGYSFLSFISNVLLLLVSILFFWAKSASLLNRPLPPLPDLELSEDCVGKTAEKVRAWMNSVLRIAHDIAIKKDMKLFLEAVFGLWVVSYVGKMVSFVSLMYIGVLLSFSVPAVYEKYQHHIDVKLDATHNVVVNRYRNINEAVLSKIPIGITKNKKSQ